MVCVVQVLGSNTYTINIDFDTFSVHLGSTLINKFFVVLLETSY
jgi:hypothetical protein